MRGPLSPKRGETLTTTERSITTTQDAIKIAKRLLDQAEAHYLLRLYRPDDERLTRDLDRCLALSRVAVAQALDIEAGDAE